MKSEKRPLLTIKQFAVLCRTTPRTIRFYDQKGLIKPKHVDSVTGYRLYDPHQAREFFKVRLLQNFHVPLRAIKATLKKATEKTFLEPELHTISEDIVEKTKEYEFLKNIRMFLFGRKPATLFLKSEVWGPYILFSTFDTHSRYDKINSVILHLMEKARELKIPITDRQLVFYHDPITYKPHDTRLEICLVCEAKTIPEDITLPDGYYFSRYPRTKVKVYTYRGPFEYITLVYQKIHEGKTSPVLKPHEVGFDLHTTGPWNMKSPYDFVTKIAFQE